MRVKPGLYNKTEQVIPGFEKKDLSGSEVCVRVCVCLHTAGFLVFKGVSEQNAKADSSD